MNGTKRGYFTVLSAKPVHRDRFRLSQLEVRDDRCGHVNYARDVPSRTFKGQLSLCGCPVRQLGAAGYVIWSWRMPNKTQVRIPEHRIVMESAIDRELLPEENVHHINGNRADNRPENLELWNTHQPKGQRVEDKIKWAKQILSLYEPEALA